MINKYYIFLQNYFMNPKTFRTRRKTTLTQRDTPPQTVRRKKSTLESQPVKARSKSSCSNCRENYNKYYIHPQLRYRSKVVNPKQVPENYTDETFLYKNLHNTEFWNWTHPLDFTKLKPIANPSPDKVNVSVLEKFRNYMQQTANKRVPLVIRDYLYQYSTRL